MRRSHFKFITFEHLKTGKSNTGRRAPTWTVINQNKPSFIEVTRPSTPSPPSTSVHSVHSITSTPLFSPRTDPARTASLTARHTHPQAPRAAGGPSPAGGAARGAVVGRRCRCSRWRTHRHPGLPAPIAGAETANGTPCTPPTGRMHTLGMPGSRMQLYPCYHRGSTAAYERKKTSQSTRGVSSEKSPVHHH